MGCATVLLEDVISKAKGSPSDVVIQGLQLYCEIKLFYVNSFQLLQDRYTRMLKDKTFTDCIFKVGDVIMKAHRCVLVQGSVVFKIMFGGVGMIEARTGEVTISDTTPECFRALLEYIYTGKIGKDVLKNNVEGIFAIAHKYQVEMLQYECERYLTTLLNAETFLNCCSIISLYGATTLEIACKEYCLKNNEIFFASKEWKDVKETYPELATKFMDFYLCDGIYGDYYEVSCSPSY
ncbi:unnamed protein product [Meloidogyne enterolobii]|uniref:Uncharacterized protein n=1 Tax=Meloidogyne enterolobii TaxID=390850 RepID=A0ACB1ABV2_MELEN